MLPARWPWRPRPVGLAFTDRFLLARRAGNDSRTLRRELSPGLLTPSVSSPNIQSVKDVAKLAIELLDELGANRMEVSLVLPDLAVSTSFSAPSVGGPHSPGASAAESRSDSWRGRKGEVLTAAVREAVVRQYEQVVEAADCRPGLIDGASLVRIPPWAEESLSEPGLSVRVQMHPSHYVLAAFRAGELVDLRTRLRAPGNFTAVREELSRFPAIYGVASLSSVIVSGDGALDCARALAASGVAGVAVGEESEEAQLAAVLDGLLRRGRS